MGERSMGEWFCECGHTAPIPESGRALALVEAWATHVISEHGTGALDNLLEEIKSAAISDLENAGVSIED